MTGSNKTIFGNFVYHSEIYNFTAPISDDRRPTTERELEMQIVWNISNLHVRSNFSRFTQAFYAWTGARFLGDIQNVTLT